MSWARRSTGASTSSSSSRRRPPTSDTKTSGQVQGPGAPLLLLHDLQVRHRRLHRAEAHLRGPGLAIVQSLRHRQGLAGHHRPLAGRLLLAGAEDHRPRRHLVGGRQGLVDALPEVERIIYLPCDRGDADGPAVDHQPDRLLARPAAADDGDDPRRRTRRSSPTPVSEPPYGYVDWWPTSLYVNNEREPFNDTDVRWALSYFIDRDQVIEVALGGAGSTWPLPLPSYPGCSPSRGGLGPAREVPDPGVQPREGRGAARRKGWTKKADGMWAKDGTTLDLDDR